MLGVHVCVNFENKSAKLIFFRFDDTNCCLPRNRCWRNSDKRIQQFLDTEIIYGAPKKYRRHLAVQVVFNIKIRIDSFNQFYICPKLSGVILTDVFLQYLAMNVTYFYSFFYCGFAGPKKV